jgi:hypothetical protein
MSIAIKQPDAEDLLKIGDNFRNDRLRNGELFCCLGNAAGLDNCQKDMQVAQLDASTDAVGPIHDHSIDS